MKPGEICDDGIPNDDKGCLPDCSGPIPGWQCTGGDPLNPVTCVEVCGDDIITESEECEDWDGGPTALDGCN